MEDNKLTPRGKRGRSSIAPSVETPTSNKRTRKSIVQTPVAKTPQPKTPAMKTPKPKTPAVKTPKPKTPAANTPQPNAPAANTPQPKTPDVKTPQPKTPEVKTPQPKTPDVKTPQPKTPAVKTPQPKTPEVKTPAVKTPQPKTPGAKKPQPKTPAAKTPQPKTPAAKTPQPKTPAAKTPQPKTPAAKTPQPKTPAAKTPQPKTPAAKTPQPKTPAVKTPQPKTPKAKTPQHMSPPKSGKQKRKSIKAAEVEDSESSEDEEEIDNIENEENQEASIADEEENQEASITDEEDNFENEEDQEASIADDEEEVSPQNVDNQESSSSEEENVTIPKVTLPAKPTLSKAEVENSTIFVGNLPKDITRDKLKKLFSKFGSIENVRLRSAPVADSRIPKKVAVIKKEFHKDRTSICGYVCFTSFVSACKSLKANGTLVDKHHIRVDLARHSKPDIKKAVFVGNLPFDAEEEELREMFTDCGDIVGVRIIRSNVHGISKGFAYVNFESTDAVELALTKEGTVLQGRPLRVQRCQENPKKKARKPQNADKKFRGQKSDVRGKGANKTRKPKARTMGKDVSSPKASFQGQKAEEKGKVQKKNKAKKANFKKQDAIKALLGKAKKNIKIDV